MINYIKGNILEISCNALFIPTNGNIGKNGRAIMGKGLALQVAEKYPHIPLKLGIQLKIKNHVIWELYNPQKHHFYEGILYSFPTKYNWWEKANIGLIENSLKEVERLCNIFPYWEKVLLPKVGCGLGGLDWRNQVFPLIEKIISEKNKKIIYIVENQ